MIHFLRLAALSVCLAQSASADIRIDPRSVPTAPKGKLPTIDDLRDKMAPADGTKRGDRSKAGRFTNYSGQKGCDGGEKDESAGGKEKPSEHTWEKAGKDKGAWAMIAVDPNLWKQARGCTGTLNGRKVKVWDKCGACRGKGFGKIDMSRDCGKGNRLPADEIPPGEIQWDESCHLDKKGYDKPSIGSENKCQGGKASKDCKAAPDVSDSAPADGPSGAKPAPKNDEEGPAPAPSGGTQAQKGDSSGQGSAPPAAPPPQQQAKPKAPSCTPDGQLQDPNDPAQPKCCSVLHKTMPGTGFYMCGVSD